jgi:hypothetical protein
MIGLMVLLAFGVCVVQRRILIESLAVRSLLEKLNPAIGLEGTGALLKGAATNAGKGEEIILDALFGLRLGKQSIQTSDGGAFA